MKKIKEKITAFVPPEKQSKKAQKAYHSKYRITWGEMSPVTRVVKNKKAYDRKRDKSRFDDRLLY